VRSGDPCKVPCLTRQKGRLLQQSVPPETSRRLDAFQFGKVKIADSPQGLRGGALGQRANWHRKAVCLDHRRIIDAGGRHPQLVGGVGKRRSYATIFSFDRPRSRSISTERRGGSLSQAGFTPRSSARPWPPPYRPLVFTRASPSVFIRPFPQVARQCGAVYDNTHRLYAWAGL